MAGKFNLTELLNQRSKEKEAEQEDGKQEEKMEIEYVDVYDLIPSKENFYHVDERLKKNIEIMGLLQPILVKRPVGGKYEVIAGHRRRLALIALVEEGKEKFRQVPCVFKQESAVDRLALIMANGFRDKTDWEKMIETVETERLVLELKKENQIKGNTREMLAEVTGVTEAQLGRYKSIYNNLIPELLEAFKNDNIIISVAVELCGLPEEWQEKAAERVREGEKLSLADARQMKRQEEESRQIPGQMDMDTCMNPPEEEEKEDRGQQEEERSQKSEEAYIDPQPEEITSLCYSCMNYETCHEKKATVRECNAYKNRREAQKTEEERYSEEQAAIDRETERKLREMRQEEKMNHLPSDQAQPEEKVHEVKLAAMYYDDVKTGKKTFELRKNDRNYKEGDKLHMLEFKDGRHTGRTISADIVYLMEEYTGLTEGYCILGIRVTAAD
jgi:ParB-like chromosome segregation protein Spo0J|nr:MAG TPA: chromosome partitioning protein [Caudoviricetes sp.]